MRGMYWEEWEIGAEFESPARTVTEADIVMFAGLSGDYNPLHVNEEYCKTTIFGTRIAHGPLVYAITAGLLFQLHLYDDTLIAFLGFENLKFTKPVKPGDTIRARIKVLDKRGWSQVLPDPDEPLLHLYAEGDTPAASEELEQELRELVEEIMQGDRVAPRTSVEASS